MRRQFYVAAIVACVALSGCAQSKKRDGDKTLYWAADKVAQSNANFIALKTGQDGKIYYNIETTRVRKLVEIHRRIESAAGKTKSLLYITSGDKANAFAFYNKEQPVIAVNIALLDLLSDDADELAAIIGHELAHIYEGHGSLRKERRENLTIAANVGAVILGLAGVPGGGHLSGAAANIVNSSYSKDEERDADRIGLNFSWKAGYSPWGAVRAQEKLEKISSSSWLPLMNSHPPSAERTQTMRELATRLSGGHPNTNGSM